MLYTNWIVLTHETSTNQLHHVSYPCPLLCGCHCHWILSCSYGHENNYKRFSSLTPSLGKKLILSTFGFSPPQDECSCCGDLHFITTTKLAFKCRCKLPMLEYILGVWSNNLPAIKVWGMITREVNAVLTRESILCCVATCLIVLLYASNYLWVYIQTMYIVPKGANKTVNGYNLNNDTRWWCRNGWSIYNINHEVVESESMSSSEIKISVGTVTMATLINPIYLATSCLCLCCW